MKLPRLSNIASSQSTVDVFKGYNHNLRIGDGEFFDMKNMTSDFYPVASSRAARGIKTIFGLEESEIIDTIFSLGSSYGYIVHTNNGKDQLRIPFENVNGEPYNSFDLDNHGKTRNVIVMGAYLIILPDKKIINTAKPHGPGSANKDSLQLENIDANFMQEDGSYTFYFCEANGKYYDPKKITGGVDPPTNPANGSLWLDQLGNPTIKRWSSASNSWETIVTNYVRIEVTGIGIPFKKGDGVHAEFRGMNAGSDETLDGLGDFGMTDSGWRMLAADWVIHDKGDDYIVVKGVLGDPTITGKSDVIEVKRTMPEMDYVIESGNRLWGCRYGAGDDGAVINEIYASKLGDPTNWRSYQGISTDSYAVSIGADGPFTGAVNYRGIPVFFKEGHLIEIQGAYPAQYRVQSTICRGVQEGCGKSLAVVNNVLYYKTRGSVCYYDGSLPDDIGYALGMEDYSEAKSAVIGSKCYMNMKDTDENWKLFVLDTEKGIWHLEDDIQVKAFCTIQNSMLCLLSDNKTVYQIGWVERDAEKEDTFGWMVQSGDIGIQLPESKYVSRIIVRMLLEEGGEVSFFAQYDFEEEWIHLCSIPATHLKSVELPIRPRRCDHMKLRIEGIGGAKIYSITKTIEKGSGV